MRLKKPKKKKNKQTNKEEGNGQHYSRWLRKPFNQHYSWLNYGIKEGSVYSVHLFKTCILIVIFFFYYYCIGLRMIGNFEAQIEDFGGGRTYKAL